MSSLFPRGPRSGGRGGAKEPREVKYSRWFRYWERGGDGALEDHRRTLRKDAGDRAGEGES